MSDEPSAEKLNYWMERCTHFENAAAKAQAEAARLREDHAGRALGEQIAKRSQERDAARAAVARLRQWLRIFREDLRVTGSDTSPEERIAQIDAALAQEPKQ